MLSHLIKSLITVVAVWLVNHYRRLSIDLLKIEGAAYYLKAIKSGREGFLSVLRVWLGVFFFALGVVMLHAGLFMCLYLLTEKPLAVAIGLLGLGGLYVIVILLIARRALSEESWMKFFKADKLVEKLTKKP
jgi:hypothetical protein